jgi:hypothetical protein
MQSTRAASRGLPTFRQKYGRLPPRKALAVIPSLERGVEISRNLAHNARLAKKRPKRPRDPTQLGELIVDIATGNTQDAVHTLRLPRPRRNISRFFELIGRALVMTRIADSLGVQLPKLLGEKLAAQSLAPAPGQRNVRRNKCAFVELFPRNDVLASANHHAATAS